MIRVLAAILISALVLGFFSYADGERIPRSSDNDGERYLNKYEPGEQPEWVPEEQVSVRAEEERSLPHLNTIAYEINNYPRRKPTAEDYEAAWALYNRSFEAAESKGFFDVENATSDGFRPYNTHYMNQDYLNDGEALNPYKPESLVYYHTESGKLRLAGYMYLAETLEQEGKQVAGPLTLWHYHPRHERKCVDRMVSEGASFGNQLCEGNVTKKYRTPEMIHVWFIEHPRGPFSTGMRVHITNDSFDQGLNHIEKMEKQEFINYTRRNHGDRVAK